MTLVAKRPAALLITAVITAVLLPVMAALQYKWIGEVSRAAKERMSNEVKRNTNSLVREFDSQFRQLGFREAVGRRQDIEGKTPVEMAALWIKALPDSGLLRDAYVVSGPEGKPRKFLQLDLKTGAAHPVDPPAELTAFAARLKNSTSSTDPDLPAHAMPMPQVAGPQPQPIRGDRPPRRDFNPEGRGGPPRDREGRGPPPFDGAERGRRFQDRPGPGMDEDRGFPPPRRDGFPPPRRDETTGPRPRPRPQRNNGATSHYDAWIVFICDTNYIAKTFLPELINRHFGSQADFLFRVVRKNAKTAPIFSTGDFDTPDASMNLLQLMEGQPEGQVTAETGLWTLQVRNRAGSLETIVAETQRRDLIISIAILAVLGLSISSMIVVSRRMASLAQMQMEFVAGVSHELRTPLAVVNAAADNLAAGIVQPDSVKRYGALIRRETKRLGRMVEDVLAFSGIEHSKRPRNVQHIEIGTMVEAALTGCAQDLTDAGFEVEKSLAPNLPAIQGDPAWLEQCLRNLIGNALKYAKAGKWLGVRAASENGMAVIRIEDHGPGIESGDAKKIFTPFFRSRSASDAQIEGSGIGLSVVKRIVEAHGGSVTVESEPGAGCRFIVRLPFAPVAPGETTT